VTPSKKEEIEQRFGQEGLDLLYDRSITAEKLSHFFQYKKGMAISPTTIKFLRREQEYNND